MALTAKERMARWRAKQRETPEAHEAYKEKERQRNNRRRKEGQFKYASEMSPRELRNARRRWRQNSKHYRKRNQTAKNLLTPPTSPVNPEREHVQQERNTRADAIRRSIARKSGRERSKCYRENSKLKIKLKIQERLAEKYKKWYNRERRKHLTQTDNKKPTKQYLDKSYKLYRMVIANIRMKYQNSKSNTEKRKIASLITSRRILKQYRISSFAHTELSFSRRHLQQKPLRKSGLNSLRVKSKVMEFYERDDVSRMKPDKQATITRHGVKKQIRLLSDDLKTFHMKFVSEHDHQISYSLFCQLRPFWVIKPTEKDRNTCLCRIHDNLHLKLKAAHSAAMVCSKDINEVIKSIVCDNNNKQCMYRECSKCANKKVAINHTQTDGKSNQIMWFEWKTVREEVIQNGQKKTVTKVVKSQEQGSREVLANEIFTECTRACRHIYNIRHRYKSLRQLKSQLSEDEVMLHVDFSENYIAKYADEIQSMHFGGSRNLISLHTGFMYLNNKTQAFCSVSDCLRHDPAAIWAHLDPVLKDITSKEKLTTIHFVTDGPTTQYRNKQNFHLWGHKISKYGFERSTWNFLEASHGKGAADGIGAAVKRSADNQVLVRKQDVTCAKDFVNLLTEGRSNVQLYLVDGKSIDAVEKELPSTLKPLPSTMKIHQLVLETADAFISRVVSCFCSHPSTLSCSCFDPASHRLHPEAKNTDCGEICSENQQVHAQTKAKKQSKKEQPLCELEPVLAVDESLVGRYVVVVYDKKPFPGVIQAADEDDIEVKAMHSVGQNRYFWPLIEDVCWYHLDKIVTLLPSELEPVTNRHWQIPPSVWKLIVDKLDL